MRGMTYTYYEFKGKHNRKYKIRRFDNEAYQFYEDGQWKYEMAGEIGLQMLLDDIDRKGGKLVKAYSNDDVKTIKTELYRDMGGKLFEIEYLNSGRVGIKSKDIHFGLELNDFLEMIEMYNWETA